MHSLWILAAEFFYAFTALCIKLSSADIGALEAVFYRSVFACVLVAVPALAKGGSLLTPLWKAHLFRAVAGTTSQTIWILTLPLMPLAMNMTLTNTMPLYMAASILCFCLIKKENVPWKVLSMVALGFIGVLLVLRPQGGVDIIPFLGALSCGFFTMLAFSTIKYVGNRGEPAWRIVFYYTAFGTIYGLLGTVFLEDGFVDFTPENLMYICGIGFSAMGAQICNAKGYGKGNLLLNSTLQYSVIVFSEIFGFFVLSETLSVAEAFGIAIICAAAIFATYFTKQWQKSVKNKPSWS